MRKPTAMKRYSCFLLLVLVISSCEISVKSKPNEPEVKGTKSAKDNKQEKTDATTNSDADILNNIELFQSGDLKVAQAYLTFNDGNLVPKDNKVPLGETVNLTLAIEGGWEVRDGQSSIDATEIISTDKGEIILNAPNLFKSKPTLDEVDAKRVFLKATITKTRPDIQYFMINYRVWDKWSDAEVRGSYKLYVADEKQTE
jgi:hypothetical protein